MSTDNIGAARAAFAEFERDMTKTGADSVLQEGVDYALDIIEAIHSDVKSKEVARNLLDSYRRKIIDRITVVVNDAGSFEVDYYLHWVSLAHVFQKADYDKDKKLSDLIVKLAVKSDQTLSKDERSALLRKLQRELDSK